MAWSYDQTIAAAWQENEIEYKRALAEIDAAHVAEDWPGLQYATNRLQSAEQQAAWLSQKANNLHQQQQRAQAQPRNRHNFSNTEVDIALNSFQDRPDLPRLTRDQKLDLYQANKQRYWQMRNSGQYRDDQGTVRR
jgi:hypothetical protein